MDVAGTGASSSVEVGEIIADKYRVVRLVGEGGMGVVLEGEPLAGGPRVAIKLLALSLLAHPQARDRFTREALACMRLRSPHVARTLDHGELPSGQPYLVMELLRGADLEQLLVAHAVELPTVVTWVVETCEALAEAHAAGIVHRDIKPANLFIARQDDGTTVLKLLDFGIASAPDAGSKLTQTGMLLGTPAYMSPEQMESSRGAEPSWDVWSLAVVLYEAAEQTLPFPGASLSEIMVAVLTKSMRPCARAPQPIKRILERALHRDPAQRLRDLYDFATALAPHAGKPEAAQASLGRIAAVLGRPAPEARAADAGGWRVTPASAPLPVAAPVRVPIASPEAVAVPVTSGAYLSQGDGGFLGDLLRSRAMLGAIATAFFIGVLVLVTKCVGGGDAKPPADAAAEPSVEPDEVPTDEPDAAPDEAPTVEPDEAPIDAAAAAEDELSIDASASP